MDKRTPSAGASAAWPPEDRTQTRRVCISAPFSPVGSAGTAPSRIGQAPILGLCPRCLGLSSEGVGCDIQDFHYPPSDPLRAGRVAGELVRVGLKVNNAISCHPSHPIALPSELVRCGVWGWGLAGNGAVILHSPACPTGPLPRRSEEGPLAAGAALWDARGTPKGRGEHGGPGTAWPARARPAGLAPEGVSPPAPSGRRPAGPSADLLSAPESRGG